MPTLKPRIERVLLKRKEAGRPISQKEIADRLNVTKQQVSMWVNGRSFPRVPTLFRLAHLLECQTDDLYEYDE